MLTHNLNTAEMAEAINTARHNLSLTQGELADLCGITAKSIGRYEGGHMRPGPKTVAKLNAALFRSEPDQSAQLRLGEVALVDASIESIVEELKSRGFKHVTLSAG